jgi:hypothetical protein
MYVSIHRTNLTLSTGQTNKLNGTACYKTVPVYMVSICDDGRFVRRLTGDLGYVRTLKAALKIARATGLEIVRS